MDNNWQYIILLVEFEQRNKSYCFAFLKILDIFHMLLKFLSNTSKIATKKIE